MIPSIETLTKMTSQKGGLEELPKKSRAEKLEAAYDGAVNTHGIGFPKLKKP